ncbi:hypothetical protein ILUMI_01956 [Ignelater luminosus]|uniref:Uncharacterized protein n=1 Tax=Ignelater luminosus TaxID=2038154 RepID=A0A8K0DPQ3_IGNLU|nr:hypothetical protein ILUMI_01956 [Ignelater luminosus]
MELFIIAAVGLVIVLVISILLLFSDKPIKHIIAEIKYEIIYNVVGSKALLEDIVLREKNDSAEIPMGKGKVALITGGARGIGVEVVKKLVERDVHVIIGCRNVSSGEKVFQDIRQEGIEKGDVKVFPLDLASLQSIKSFANMIKSKYSKIHILINNAGKMFGPYMETEDGFESQFQTNYLGHFLLTHLLLPELKAAGEENSKSRIVNVSSCAHLVGDIDFDDINFRKQYIASAAYAQSKLAQILFSNHLHSLMKQENAPVAVYSLHPGIVDTELFDGTYLKKLAPGWAIRMLFKTPQQGAVTILYASLSHKLENHSGTYLSNCHIMPPCELAYSTNLQDKLFEYSKSLLGIKLFGKE